MDDLDRVVRLIATGCQDALSGSELNEVEARLAQRSVVQLEGETAEKLIAALDALEQRWTRRWLTRKPIATPPRPRGAFSLSGRASQFS
jgi:hypothetical protein